VRGAAVVAATVVVVVVVAAVVVVVVVVVVAVRLVLPATGDSAPAVAVRRGEGGRDTELSVERIEILDLLLGVTDGRERGGSEERTDEKVGGEKRTR